MAPGISTGKVDGLAKEVLAGYDAGSAFEGYRHELGERTFAGVSCTSVNSAVVHGIRSRGSLVQAGDVISVDFGCEHLGVYGDSAPTSPVGEVAEEVLLLDVSRQALRAGIGACKVGALVMEIGAAIEGGIRPSGLGLVAGFVGDDIGREVHEDPAFPNGGCAGQNPVQSLVLEAGLVLATESMVNLGLGRMRRLGDGWTIVTVDGLSTAHFERTVAITEDGPIVLTSRS